MESNLPYIYPIDTLTDQESARWDADLESRSYAEVDLLTDFSTADFLRKRLAPMYGLSEPQLKGVARFIVDLVITGVSTNQSATVLAQRAQVSLPVATQMVGEMEAGLLQPLGLTMSGLTAPAQQPIVVQNAAGKAGLRYGTLEDLLSDIADLTPSERARFLESAKNNNRVFVIQALTQLKLGTGPQGQPLTFRELVAKELPQFGGQDWTDLATANPESLADPAIQLALLNFLTSPERASALLGTLKTPQGLIAVATLLDAQASSHLGQYWQDCPLGALLRDRQGIERQKTAEQFLRASSDTQDLLIAVETSETLHSWAARSIVPSTHRIAVAKLTAMTILGDVSSEQLEPLLQRLELPPTQASQIAASIQELLPQTTSPEPPSSAPTPPAPAPIRVKTSVGVQQRNIIDLRKPQ